MMQDITIAFDIDGTLRGEYKVNEEIVELLKFFSTKFKNTRVIVWSGGGKDYAQRFVDSMKLEKYVDAVYGKSACTEKVDIAIDDIHTFNLADKNLIVRMK